MSVHSFGRLRFLAFFLLLSSTVAFSQVSGINVNMVSGTQWPDGDPFLQRQNEPSAAVSSRNAQHLLAGANDYRTVDIPNPLTDAENGDAWVGVFRSIDGGLTWKSTLLPGYPQDTSAVGMASPLKAYGVATDPTVRAGTHGMFYFSGLVFNRNNGPTGVFVATMQDQNNKGNGDPFGYVGAKVIDTGTSGQFLDKPWLAVDIPRGNPVGSATCTIGGKTFSSGNAYFIYSKFLGGSSANNPHTQITMVRSTNCGASWSNPQKLSEGFQLNQGTVAAIDPNTGALYVAWRQIFSGNQPDAIVYTVSTDGGKTFSAAKAVYTFATGTAFDLNSSATQFRTIALPAMAVDNNGRVWVAFALDNQGANNAARIMMTTLAAGSSTWTAPFAADTTASATTYGHQFNPALTFAHGRLMLTFYDQRDDNTKGILTCSAGNCTETRQAVGDLANGNTNLVFNSFLSDAGLKARHTVDIRGALVDPAQFNGSTLAFPSVRISQYMYGSRPGNGPRPIEQLQFNPPNFPMFVKGTRGFIGDYMDIAAQLISFDIASGKWTFNKDHSTTAVFHPVWTDNRDVRTPPIVCDPNTHVCTQDWTQYTPVASTGGNSLYDVAQGPRPVCNPSATGSRNQNIYTARITEGLYAAFRENSKIQTTGDIIPREFALLVANNKNSTAYYRLTITPPGSNYVAAFLKDDLSKTTLDVTVLPRSTVSRSVFVIPANNGAKLPYPSVKVGINEIASIRAPSLLPNGLATIAVTNPDATNAAIVNPDIVNPDITNPDIVNPDITNPDIATAEIYNPTITNPGIVNPDIVNPDIVNPDIVNPDITNPDIVNPDIVNPDISAQIVVNPDIVNPDIVNPDIVNPDIVNPDIVNPDISALPSGTTDLTWKVTNKGNTTSAYNAKLLSGSGLCCPAGATCSSSQPKCQLVLRKTYPTPTAKDCTLTVQAQNIPISNIPNPSFTTVDQVAIPDVRPDAANSTLTLGPGEGGRMTLRVFGPVSDEQLEALKAAATAFGANTGQFTGVSLTIQTTSLPPVFIGVPYTANLSAVGGVGTLPWTVFDGTLPAGLTLNPLTGVISGTPSGSAGNTTVQFRVIDTPLPGGVQQADWKKLSFDVQQFTVSDVTVQKLSTGLSFARTGDNVQVTVTVTNLGTLTASNVIPSLTISPTSGLTCDLPVPPSDNILGGNTTVFTFRCKVGTATGPVSVAASATGSFPGGVSATTGSSSGSSATLLVENTPPTLTVSAVTAGGASYTAGTFAHEAVTVTFSCLDSESGIADGYPTGSQTISTSTNGTTLDGVCFDKAGNQSTLSFGPVKIDLDPPLISVTATTSAGAYTANTWTNKAVTVTFTCSDAGSGIVAGYPTGNAIITTTPASGVTATGTCKDNSGTTSTLTFGPVLVDVTAPTVTITSPANNSTVAYGASLTMQFTCTDGQSGIATCSGSPANGVALNTTTFGSQTVTATATDKAGNTTTVSSTFKVTYRFTGFDTPLVTAGTPTSPSFSGAFNAGKAIPIKWELFNSSNVMITDLSTLKLMVATKNAGCSGAGNGATFVLYSPTAGATGGSTFRSSSSGYIFNWDTTSVGKGCWNLILTLNDNSQYATIVQLK